MIKNMVSDLHSDSHYSLADDEWMLLNIFNGNKC